MAEKLIFVSGLSGAGKTTLVRAALGRVPDLCYLQTTTTRPKRTHESASFEYRFVSDQEYDEFRAASANWDHTVYEGYKYGADVDEIRLLLDAGKKVICCIAPEAEVAESMSRLYGSTPVVIWINTAEEVAKSRVADDNARLERNESDAFKAQADYLFTPTGRLAADEAAFAELVVRL